MKVSDDEFFSFLDMNNIIFACNMYYSFIQPQALQQYRLNIIYSSW